MEVVRNQIAEYRALQNRFKDAQTETSFFQTTSAVYRGLLLAQNNPALLANNAAYLQMLHINIQISRRMLESSEASKATLLGNLNDIAAQTRTVILNFCDNHPFMLPDRWTTPNGQPFNLGYRPIHQRVQAYEASQREREAIYSLLVQASTLMDTQLEQLRQANTVGLLKERLESFLLTFERINILMADWFRLDASLLATRNAYSGWLAAMPDPVVHHGPFQPGDDDAPINPGQPNQPH